LTKHKPDRSLPASQWRQASPPDAYSSDGTLVEASSQKGVDERSAGSLIAGVGKFSPRELAAAGLIAALYTILSIVFLPISFGVYQVRIAEALTVLPFLTRAAIPGLYIGCLLANIFGGMGWLDIVFGPLITLAAALLTRLVAKYASGKFWTYSVPFPVLLFWLSAYNLLTSAENTFEVIVGIVVLVAAVLLTAFFARTLTLGAKIDASMFLAPLPPVVLNALGVSLYLAPLLGFNYWFSVQMIGVGELIACYLIGLPLLLALRKRSIFR
jgi:uncharacterized membrane protein